MHEDATFRAGASGYVLKRSGPAEIITAMVEAMRRRLYISSLVRGDLLHTLMEQGEHSEKLKLELTPLQREVLCPIRRVADLCCNPLSRSVVCTGRYHIGALRFRSACEVCSFQVRKARARVSIISSPLFETRLSTPTGMTSRP
jgi:hypothetical protein